MKLLSIAFIVWAIWVTWNYKGTPTDERWEWEIGTNTRIKGTGNY